MDFVVLHFERRVGAEHPDVRPVGHYSTVDAAIENAAALNSARKLGGHWYAAAAMHPVLGVYESLTDDGAPFAAPSMS